MLKEFKAFVNQGSALDLAVPTVEAAKKTGSVIAYGVFLNTVIEFLVVAFTIFLVVKQINRLRGPVEKKA